MVVSGAINRGGKLPFSWPREASSHTTYDRKHTEKHYSARPQYAFGSGLSYSPVQTTAIRLLNEGNVVLGDTLRIEVDLENKGDRPTTDVVMVFAQIAWRQSHPVWTSSRLTSVCWWMPVQR